MKSKISQALLLAGCFLLFGCDYQFPLTAKPTHKIDPRLLGDWIPADSKDPGNEVMHVRDFDGSDYAVSMEKDIYRAYHSDFANLPFLSVQDLNASSRKYLYFVWHLSEDGTRLSLKSVDTKIIPETTQTTADVQRLLKEQLKNPHLFRDEVQFTRK